MPRKLTKSQKADAYDAALLVKRFNELYPIGAKVMLRKVSKDSFPYQEYTVRSEAYTLNEIQAVAFFEEISGCFSIEEPIKLLIIRTVPR